jgi:hypothetical protein
VDKNEQVTILSYLYEEDWSKVIRHDGKIGLIPRRNVRINHEPKWLYPKMSRTLAELYLNQESQPTGAFVIRCSQSRPGFALTVKLNSRGNCGHLHLAVNDLNGEISIWKQSFSNLTELADYYKEQVIVDDVRLVDPCENFAHVIAHHDFDAESQWEVSIKSGDKIIVMGHADQNWYLGYNERTDFMGILPKNYVKQINKISRRPHYITNSKMKPKNSLSCIKLNAQNSSLHQRRSNNMTESCRRDSVGNKNNRLFPLEFAN